MKKYNLHKNNWLILIGLILLSQYGFSQKIEDVYVKMPDILNPTLSKQNRLELLEYHKEHQSDSTANRFGNQAYLITMDTINQLIVVKNTPESIFEMKMLTLSDSCIVVGIIHTVCAPVCQSSIDFYDTAWHKVSLTFTLPKATEWIDTGNRTIDNDTSQWLRNMLQTGFISLTFSTHGQELIAKNNTSGFLTEEDRKSIAPYIKNKTITFQLQDRKWVKMK
jgi:hypothetical protein